MILHRRVQQPLYRDCVYAITKNPSGLRETGYRNVVFTALIAIYVQDPILTLLFCFIKRFVDADDKLLQRLHMPLTKPGAESDGQPFFTPAPAFYIFAPLLQQRRRISE